MIDRDWSDAHLVNAALGIPADDPAFGCLLLADKLPENGVIAGENKVQRLWRAWHSIGVVREARPEPQAGTTGS